jgi:hypothetical protein
MFAAVCPAPTRKTVALGLLRTLGFEIISNATIEAGGPK